MFYTAKNISRIPRLSNMSDIAVIILTKDEKMHIGRCLERIAALSPRQVLVVDCFSTGGVDGHHHKMIK